MLKFITYSVAIAILVIFGADIYLAVAGKASPTTVVEIAVCGSVILAVAIAAFIQAVKRFSWNSKHKVTVDDLDEKVDTIDTKVDTLDDKVGTLDSKVDGLDSKTDRIETTICEVQESLDARLGPEPDSFVATIFTRDENGKLVRLYDLPPSDSYEQALSDARESVQARKAEGNPVREATVTVSKAYTV